MLCYTSIVFGQTKQAADNYEAGLSALNKNDVQKAIQLGLSCGIKSNPTIIAEENANKESAERMGG